MNSYYITSYKVEEVLVLNLIGYPIRFFSSMDY